MSGTRVSSVDRRENRRSARRRTPGDLREGGTAAGPLRGFGEAGLLLLWYSCLAVHASLGRLTVEALLLPMMVTVV